MFIIGSFFYFIDILLCIIYNIYLIECSLTHQKNSMSLRKLGHTKDGYVVYSQDTIHISSYPISMILEKITIGGLVAGIIIGAITVDTDVGFCYCVPVIPSRDIFYAKYKGEDHYKKFVKNKDPIPMQRVRYSINIIDATSCSLEFLEACCYNYLPPDPLHWDLHMQEPDPAISYKVSEIFWRDHAWIDNIPGVEIDKNSITSHCPW